MPCCGLRQGIFIFLWPFNKRPQRGSGKTTRHAAVCHAVVHGPSPHGLSLKLKTVRQGGKQGLTRCGKADIISSNKQNARALQSAHTG